MSPEPSPITSPDASAPDGRVALNAALLKTLRKTRGLSQEALAELCFSRQRSVSIASIKRAETGKVVLYRTARHLADIFEIDLDQLVMTETGEPDSTTASEPQPASVSAPAPGQLPPAAAPRIVAASDSLRYVIELHIDLGASPSTEAQHEMLARIAHFGGVLAQPGATPLVALFGLPQAYRSDAERSMRCAIALRGALLVHGLRALALRLVRWRDGAAEDASLPLPPARSGPGIDPLAAPIQVAPMLAGQLAARFEFSDAPCDSAGADSAAHYLDYLGERTDAPLQALSGRVAETRQFAALADAAGEAGGTHVVYLRAMAGVGKTRLATEFGALAAARGFQCHRSAVADAGADSWRAPLGELARSLYEDSQHAPDTANDIFYLALTGARMSSDQMSLYAAMSHAVRERGMADAMAKLIVRCAARAPLLLAIDDLHWGENYLFDALGALLGATREAQVIWVLGSRIEDDPLEESLRQHLFELPVTVLDLAPLAPRDALALAEQYDDVAPDQRQRCVERAQGNPLFLTQLLASPDTDLPDSLKHLVQARLDTLPAIDQRALRAASVLGSRFELASLTEVLGEPYQPDLARRNSMLRRLGPGTCGFVHDLVMHCIYDLIEPEQQRRLHRAVAALYRERDPAQSAQHLYRAADPGAFDMMLRAIRDRLAAHEYEAALELTGECSANDSTRLSSFTLALLKAHAIAGLGQLAESREAYQHALMLAGRPQEKIDAVIGLATTLNILEQLDEEERLLDDTLPLARSIDADAALARLLYLKGNIYFPRGNYSECRRHHQDAVRHARAASTTEVEARALSGMGDSYYAQGHMVQSNRLFGECIQMCEQYGYVGIEASNRSALGSTSIYLGKPGEAAADALQSALLAHKVGNRRAEVVARMTAGWVLVATGELDQAESEVARALVLARSMGNSRFEPFLMESEARIAWLRGDRALAERRVMAAAEAVQRMQLQRFIGPWVLGTVALFTSDAAVRKRALLQGAAYLTRDCLAHNAFRFFVSAAEVSMLDGDVVSAGFYAEQLAAYAPAEPCAWVEHHVALVQAYADYSQAPAAAARVASRDTLRSLHGQAQEHGFMHATPRLFEALTAM